KDRDDGFVALFNGKDLTGWKTHPDQPGGWTVEDGYLTGRSSHANHLFSQVGDYRDFHLKAQGRIHAGGKQGLFLRTAYAVDRSTTLGKMPTGYEAQIIHEPPRPSYALTGSLLGMPSTLQ